MKTNQNSGGFTLIELLVVVLIIGILAAVAVPQYQKAIVKAKFAPIPIVANRLLQAEIVYYYEHGDWTQSLSDLDIQVPAGCKLMEEFAFERFICPFGQGTVEYSVWKSGGWRVTATTSSETGMWLYYYIMLTPEGTSNPECMAQGGDKMGKYICEEVKKSK